jgi:hypothetical protein
VCFTKHCICIKIFLYLVYTSLMRKSTFDAFSSLRLVSNKDITFPNCTTKSCYILVPLFSTLKQRFDDLCLYKWANNCALYEESSE